MYSLTKILNDPSLLIDNERLKKQIEEVKKDKQGLSNAASSYNVRYKEEIEEGTRKAQLLISEGEDRGLSEEEALKSYGKFLPTRRTPLLNFLYFLLKEDDRGEEFEQLRVKYNNEYGHLEESYTPQIEQNVPTMDELIYGDCSMDIFQKIKKLKRLSKDISNEHEAFLAWKLCNELCTKFHLEIDKIPS